MKKVTKWLSASSPMVNTDIWFLVECTRAVKALAEPDHDWRVNRTMAGWVVAPRGYAAAAERLTKLGHLLKMTGLSDSRSTQYRATPQGIRLVVRWNSILAEAKWTSVGAKP